MGLHTMQDVLCTAVCCRHVLLWQQDKDGLLPVQQQGVLAMQQCSAQTPTARGLPALA